MRIKIYVYGKEEVEKELKKYKQFIESKTNPVQSNPAQSNPNIISVKQHRKMNCVCC